jgi:arginyl-tRNA synthetase
MLLPVHDALRARVRDALAERYGLDEQTMPSIALEYPPNRSLGDLGTPVAFELARRLRKAPRAIAQELAETLGRDRSIRVAAAPNGYLNFFLDRRAFLIERLTSPAVTAPAPASAGKTIVEHTAINPNKAAHVGHLRNSALGDTLVRVLRFRGTRVEVQNYIDDTGVQVADVVVGFRVLEKKTLDDIRAIADTTRFDHYCWDLYARVTEWYEGDPARLAIRNEALHDLEHGGNEGARIGAFIVDRIVRLHLQTMRRINIDYDLLTCEGDILRLQFWARAFEILKASGSVFLQTQGRLAGCWVMRIDEAPLERSEADAGEDEADAGEPDDGGEDAREKVIVRSNGIVTYVGKDIAYQFWKFGLLGRDFHYRRYDTRPDGGVLWATASEPTPDEATAPAFGRADTTYNVIDDRQSYLQKLLQQALVTLGYPTQAERSIHFSYGLVALSHATAKELGYTDESEADAKRPFVEVSGRKGRGVKADDLIDRLIARASEEVTARNPELGEEDRRRTASMIAVAAVRYFLIKYSRTRIIAFDIAEALNFEGESGPYLQYAVVRANNIFNKLRDRDGLTEADIIAALPDTPSDELDGKDGSHDLWALALEAARLDEVVDQVVRTLEFSVLAKFAFGLAQAFNAFYHRYPILNEERADVRRWRAGTIAYVRTQLARALGLMGVAVPPRM